MCDLGRALKKHSLDVPTCHLHVSSPFPVSPTVDCKVLLPVTFHPPACPLRGVPLTPAKPQPCPDKHSPFSFCDSAVELDGVLVPTPGKMQGECPKRPTTGLSSALTEGSNSCGGVISSPSGSFSSPWYPANYPTDVECIWVIHVAEKFHIQLTVPSLR